MATYHTKYKLGHFMYRIFFIQNSAWVCSFYLHNVTISCFSTFFLTFNSKRKNAEKDDFDQQTVYKAPIPWLKYTTPVACLISFRFCFFSFSKHQTETKWIKTKIYGLIIKQVIVKILSLYFILLYAHLYHISFHYLSSTCNAFISYYIRHKKYLAIRQSS